MLDGFKEKYFFIRIVKHWNGLSRELVKFLFMENFKSPQEKVHSTLV